MKYESLTLIEFGGKNRELEFRVTPDGGDIKASISINGEEFLALGNRKSLKILNDFIDQWVDPWFSLSVRARNCILAASWETWRNVSKSHREARLTPQQVRELINAGTINNDTHNLGKVLMVEIQQWLKDNGA